MGKYAWNRGSLLKSDNSLIVLLFTILLGIVVTNILVRKHGARSEETSMNQPHHHSRNRENCQDQPHIESRRRLQRLSHGTLKEMQLN